MDLEKVKEILDAPIKINYPYLQNTIESVAEQLVDNKIRVLRIMYNELMETQARLKEELNRLTTNNISVVLPKIIDTIRDAGFVVEYVSKDGNIYITNNDITIVPDSINWYDGLRYYKPLMRYKVRGVTIRLRIRNGKVIMASACTSKHTYHVNIHHSSYLHSVLKKDCYDICMGTMDGAEFNAQNLRAFLDELKGLNLNSAYRQSRKLKELYEHAERVDIIRG